MKDKRIKIKLVKSLIRKKPNQRLTAKALGLRHIGTVVEQNASPTILGMVKVIEHMVQVEEIK
jgi:large subunit ribosomal protein L30